ncbi:MAG TPA: phosphohistidine phosphatase SixA [Verrucomicrobiales bacterium]|nr:phosphohistidine phosphatase SixA [Verrucomicrobiales bacterium]
MTDLYILRHAIAAPAERTRRGVPDRERELTQEGRRKLKGVARAFRAMGPSVDLILSSPYVRARETAELVAKTLGIMDRIRLSEHLTPDGDPARLLQQLFQIRGPLGGVLLVGHDLHLQRLVSTLLTGGTGLQFTLKRAGLCKLTLPRLEPGRCATLEWLLTPRQMIAMW